jgi:hypothetical protein
MYATNLRINVFSKHLGTFDGVNLAGRVSSRTNASPIVVNRLINPDGAA